MSIWKAPVAVAQKFAANEYVSACTATIECDLPIEYGWYKYKIDFGKTIPTIKGDLSSVYYNPCGEEHEVDIHGELIPITITEGYPKKGDPSTPLPEPIDCYFFVEYTEDGKLLNGHCTLYADGFKTNKS